MKKFITPLQAEKLTKLEQDILQFRTQYAKRSHLSRRMTILARLNLAEEAWERLNPDRKFHEVIKQKLES